MSALKGEAEVRAAKIDSEFYPHPQSPGWWVNDVRVLTAIENSETARKQR
jgi:hypothetical protein